MRTFFCLCVLLSSLSAQAGVLKQDNHRRFIFRDEYTGYYVISTYMAQLDKVRFDACEGGTYAKCTTITELSHTKLKTLKDPMLEMLRKFRAEVEEKKNNFWVFISRYGMKSYDVEAIDQIIAEVEQHGPGSLVLLTDENISKDSPALSTVEFTRELTARMKTVLESGPALNEVDCIPYLRQQGL